MVLIIDLNYLLHRCLYGIYSLTRYFLYSEGERLCDKLGDKIKQFGGTDDKTKKKLATDILALDGKVKKLIAAANLYFKNTQLQSKPPGI